MKFLCYDDLSLLAISVLKLTNCYSLVNILMSKPFKVLLEDNLSRPTSEYCCEPCDVAKMSIIHRKI